MKLNPKYLTPVSIIVAGLLIGGGIVLSKIMPVSPDASAVSGSLDDRLIALAGKVNLNKKAFASCLETGKKAEVDADIATGQAVGAVGTPYFIVTYKDGSRAPFIVPGAAPKEMWNDILAGKSIQGFEVEPAENFQPVQSDDFYRGPADANIILIEYSDMDCPYCHRVHLVIQDLIKERSDIAWVYRQFPIPKLHPEAYRKAEAAECAGQLGGNDAFWAYTDQLMLGSKDSQ